MYFNLTAKLIKNILTTFVCVFLFKNFSITEENRFSENLQTALRKLGPNAKINSWASADKFYTILNMGNYGMINIYTGSRYMQ